MIKFCVQQWDRNKDKLRKHLSEGADLNYCSYLDLVKLVVEYIFNDNDYDYGHTYDKDKITEIDNGDYQGTLLYLIPNDTYQPSENEYLMTYVGYGSCSVCDILQRIQDYMDVKSRTECVDEFMDLCRHIVQNTIKPYNTGWHHDDLYDIVEEGGLTNANEK